jgi:IclR family mhp operon transcriptional activator
MGVGFYRTAVPPDRILDTVVQPMIEAASAIQADMRNLNNTGY